MEYEDVELIVRVLKMVKDKEDLFIMLNDGIINDLVFHDFIEIDLDNETIEGTKLTEKGWKFIINN